MKAVQLPAVDEVIGPSAGQRSWLNEGELRRRAGDNLHTGLTRELWKYTPIKGFLESMAEAPADAAAGLPALAGHEQPGIRARSLAALDGAAQASIQRLVADHMNPDRHPLADLALLRAVDGWLVEVRGEVKEPLEIRYPGSGMAPVFLVLAANASLTVVEHLTESDGFLAQIGHAAVGPGARLCHHRAALHGDSAHYALQSVQVQRDGQYRLEHSTVGGKRRRTEVHVVLDGPGARADMAGAYLVEHGQHLDQQLVVEHRAARTVSRQKFHGIGAGKGKSVFNGRIHIHRHAPGSDANLTNRNLALHKDAEMNTKPELEIYTDDVSCAHGATVGQLSAAALFYLTARGIAEADARKMLSHAFVRECLDGPLAESVAARFREALA